MFRTGYCGIVSVEPHLSEPLEFGTYCKSSCEGFLVQGTILRDLAP